MKSSYVLSCVMRCIIFIVISIGCQSCGQNCYLTATRFNDGFACDNNKKFIIVPFEQQRDSLEYKHYIKSIDKKLSACVSKADNVTDADYAVYISYGISGGQEKVGSAPIIGTTGYSSSTTTGSAFTSGGYTSYSGTTTHTPTLGVVGSMPYSYTEYTRHLLFEVLDGKMMKNREVKKVYEAKIVSEGATGNLTKIFPFLVKGLFEDFPGSKTTYDYSYSDFDVKAEE